MESNVRLTVTGPIMPGAYLQTDPIVSAFGKAAIRAQALPPFPRSCWRLPRAWTASPILTQSSA
jgi:hypothetical protein